jgi:hypothetical protein
MAAQGCVDVRGGAVELSWTIRTEEGGSCSCARAEIDRIELLGTRCDHLLSGGICGAPCPNNPDMICPAGPERLITWTCEEGHGTTVFDIPEGRWAFEIEAVTMNGLSAQAAVPEPIVRDVVTGEVAMLDALLITTFTCTTP